MKLIPDCGRTDKMLECFSGRHPSPRRILSPLSSLDTFCISCYYNFSSPYYTQSVILPGLPDGAVGRQYILQKRQILFSGSPLKCNFHQRYIMLSSLLKVLCHIFDGYFCSWLNINETGGLLICNTLMM